MITIGLLLVFFLAIIAASFLPLLFPLAVGIIIQLLYLGVNSFIILCIVVISSLIMGIVRYEGDKKIMNYINEYYPALFKKKINLQDNKRGKLLLRIHNNIYIMWGCTALASWSSLPDIAIIRTVRSKLSLYQRLSAYILGKIAVYGIIIFGSDILLQLI